MNPKFTHDFSSASIKHMIEAEFYERVGKCLPKQRPSTIVTGPDYKRHIDNHRTFISKDRLVICEINLDIFIDIYKGCKNVPNIEVVNKSIENYGSTFIDCDLTCVSDLSVIKKTLLKQIETQSSDCTHNKAFILSFALRNPNGAKTKDQYLQPIFGLLGGQITHTVMSNVELKYDKNRYNWIHKYVIGGIKGRIKDYICYEYNAGGGPMLTCLLIYK